MEGTDQAVTGWRKASFSGGNGGACAEVGESGTAIVVRDTTDRAGVALRVTRGDWRRFTGALKTADEA